MLVLILGVTVLVILLYRLMVKRFNYWNDRGVQQKDLATILVGSWRVLTQRRNMVDVVETAYNMFPGKRYSGVYNMLFPILVVKDLELLKKITVKDFDHFTDHRTLVPEDADPYWAKNLFALTGQRWRDMRAILSPSFTSSKMRSIFVLIEECAESFTQYYLKQDEPIIALEMKNVFTRFANDVIATSAFGLKVDSLQEPNNEFYLMGKEATDFSKLGRILKFFLYSSIPQVKKIMKVEFFPSEVTTFFKSLISETIKTREEKGIVRPDMVHLLMESRKGIQQGESEAIVDTGFSTTQEFVKANEKLPTSLSTEDITAQALIFFVAGFDTASTLMCFMTYELAVNQDIQDRLRKEIQTTLEECGGKLTYEGLLKMKYMDMVISESLRKWPPVAALDRVCTKPYTIEPVTPEESQLTLEIGTGLLIPVYGLHRDPQYYPNPERFDPERFSDENKDKIKPYAYSPFGLGPRNCIGSRFALLEAKAIFFKLLLHFELVPVEKTVIPLKISKKSLTINAEGGFWVGLRRITKS